MYEICISLMYMYASLCQKHFNELAWTVFYKNFFYLIKQFLLAHTIFTRLGQRD